MKLTYWIALPFTTLFNKHKGKHNTLNCALVLSIVLITLVKLSLMGNGFLAFPDESRYVSSGMALKNLSQLNLSGAINDVFSTKGRPADAILKTIPTAFQLATAKLFKLTIYESNNSYPLFIFNYVVYCLLLVIHFKFSKLLLKDTTLALVSVLLFSSLTNSHLYLRHALPYDCSLLIFYLILYNTVLYSLSNRLTHQKSIVLGFFAFFAYLVYPGYFPLYVVVLFLLFFINISKDTILQKIISCSYYGLGSVCCLLLFELVSQYAGGSYIQDALTLSATVTQGSFDESFTFILKYLIEVERATGIFLIIGLLLFCVVVIQKIISKTVLNHLPIVLLGSIVITMYLTYASAGYFLHKMVLYGRLIHQYIPFICIVSLFALHELIYKSTKKTACLVILSVVITISFVINFKHYITFAYPRDIAWQLVKTHNPHEIKMVNELENSWSALPSTAELTNNAIHQTKDSLSHTILALNCAYIYPTNAQFKYNLYYPTNNYHLLNSNPHFLSFKAYQYEGYGIEERLCFDKIKLNIKVFSTQN